MVFVKVKVLVLTYCKSLENLYGNTLIFSTIRTGFPNADIEIFDGGFSIPEAKKEIQDFAKRFEFKFYDTSSAGLTLSHSEFIHYHINRNKGTVIFLDPDIIFWESFENFESDKLIAGRYLPSFYDEYTGCYTHQRLHTSFLWINDCEKLDFEITRLRKERFEFDPISPMMYCLNKKWYRYDTAAMLYNAMPDKCYSFIEAELSKYDHLFLGTHVDWVLPYLNSGSREIIKSYHKAAQLGQYEKLRGLWKWQDEYFNRYKYEHE